MWWKKKKGKLIPNNHLGVAVKYSEETARINPDMIIHEFDRIIAEKNDFIHKLSSSLSDVKIHIPKELLTDLKVIYNDRHSAREIDGFEININDLSNLFYESKDSLIIHNDRMDFLEFISKKDEHEKRINNLQNQLDIIKVELFNFKIIYKR